jgi:hypothetical protein
MQPRSRFPEGQDRAFPEYRNGQNSDIGNHPELRGIVNRVSR